MSEKCAHILRKSDSRRTLCGSDVVEGLDTPSEYSTKRRISVCGRTYGRLSNGTEVEIWTVRALRKINLSYLGHLLVRTCPECGERLFEIWEMHGTFTDMMKEVSET